MRSWASGPICSVRLVAGRSLGRSSRRWQGTGTGKAIRTMAVIGLKASLWIYHRFWLKITFRVNHTGCINKSSILSKIKFKNHIIFNNS